MPRELITEADVRALPRDADLVIPHGAIVTPSALDEAFARGLRVRRLDEAGPARAKHAGQGDCLWHRMLAGEGKFLVEVKDGRAVVWHLGSDGPVAYGRDTLEDHCG